MAKVYYERRISAARGTDSLAADIMRHLHTRQHLGKVVVLCDQPIVMLSAARKQWLKLSRVIQRQRSSTLNADKILKYTHTITRMQHMTFTMRAPIDNPKADIFFITPEMTNILPPGCMSIYDTVTLSAQEVEHIIKQLSVEAMIIDYDHHSPWHDHPLGTKAYLEEQVAIEWQSVLDFLAKYDIDISQLRDSRIRNYESMDNALDTLLDVAQGFMNVASSFSHAVEIARPLRLSKSLREEYDAVALLAHRVQALGSNAFTQRYLDSYNEDDTFFLYDSAKDDMLFTNENLSAAIARHRRHGRTTLADALQRALFFESRSPLF